MPRRGEHHHAPDRSRVALLLIDVVHDFACEDGDALHREACAVVAPLRRLLLRCRREGVPVIYVNDNFGRWRSSFEDTVARASRSARGDVIRRLRPTRKDLAVLKPGRSGFYECPLELLLEQMGVEVLVLAGFATDQCVLATTSDAVVRKFRCHVPRDCAAAISKSRHERAIALMRDAFDVDIRGAAEIDLDSLARQSR